MKIYYFANILCLLLLSGCWSYKPQTRLSKPLVVKSLVEKSVAVEKNVEKQVKDRWGKSLKKQQIQLRTAYDFDSPMAKQYRSFANAPLEKLSQNLFLDLLICLAYERNSSLKEARKKVESAKQRYSQTFFLQNLLSQYSSFTRTLDTKVGMQMQSPTIDMHTPQPARDSIMAEIINTEVKIAALEYAIVERDLINSITKNYADLVYAQESLHIQQEHQQIVSALENTARDKFRAGLTGYADVLKVQILKANIEEDTKTYAERLKTIKVSILTTLELPTDFDLGVPLKPDVYKVQKSLDALYTKGLNNRQEIKMIALKHQKLQQIISLAKDKLYPDLTTGLSYFENRNKERVGVAKQEEAFADRIDSMPQFDFGQRDSYIQEMIVENAALQEQLQNTKQKTIDKIRGLYFEVDKSWRQIVLHEKKLIPLAKEALKVTRVSYQVGKKVDFLDVLDTERTLLNLSLMLAKNKKDYQWHLVDLQKVMGVGKIK